MNRKIKTLTVDNYNRVWLAVTTLDEFPLSGTVTPNPDGTFLAKMKDGARIVEGRSTTARAAVSNAITHFANLKAGETVAP